MRLHFPLRRARSLAGSLACFAMLALLAPASQATLIADGFGDGTRDDSGDGINWYSINGQTSGGTQKPVPTVSDDSSGLMAGNALFIEGKGSNGEVMGVLPQTLNLGSQVGDKIVLSFDFRINGTNNGGNFRFGIYGDTDSQFGTPGFNTDGTTPTVWGETDGNYDAEDPGAVGDLGFFLLVPLSGNGDSARLRDELNQDFILGGSGDSDNIAAASSGTFTSITDNLKHTISFTQERVGLASDDLKLTLDVDGFILQGLNSADGNNTIVSALSFDYFVAMTNTDTDWVLDNFSLNSIAAVPEPASAMIFGCCGVLSLLARRRNR